MPVNYFDIEACLPFKFVPVSASPGIHFDDSWFHEQIRSWEKSVRYQQKWEKADTTDLFIRTTIAPQPLKVYNASGQVAKSINWTVTDLLAYKLCKLAFNISDLPDGYYWLYQQITAGDIDWKAISEPIHSKASWPGTLPVKYKNSFNTQGISFTMGLEFLFRAEMDITEMNPEVDRTAYVDQARNLYSLYGTPWRSFKLQIGKAPGVPPYIMDIINRIFSMDDITIKGKKYQRADGAKLEIIRQKGYPMVGGSLEIVEAQNAAGVHFSDGTGTVNGLVTIYNIETDFFGSGNGVQIIDVTQ